MGQEVKKMLFMKPFDGPIICVFEFSTQLSYDILYLFS